MKQVAPAPPECDHTWTGFYVGAHVGYGWGNAETDFTPLPVVGLTAVPTTLAPDPDGVVGGAQIGYNYQWNHFVFGAEGDFSGSGMDGSEIRSPIILNNGEPFGAGSFYFAREQTDWYSTVRLRLGFVPMCRLLVYGTGGLAFGRVNYSANLDFLPGGGRHQYPASTDETNVGWTAGAGTEFALNRHWSFKVEYLYYDLGDQSTNGQGVPFNPPFHVHYDWETRANTVNVGLNYHF